MTTTTDINITATTKCNEFSLGGCSTYTGTDKRVINIHKRNNTKQINYKYTYYQNTHTHTLQNPHIHTLQNKLKWLQYKICPNEGSHNVVKCPQYKVTVMYRALLSPRLSLENKIALRHFTPHHYTSHHFTYVHSVLTKPLNPRVGGDLVHIFCWCNCTPLQHCWEHRSKWLLGIVGGTVSDCSRIPETACKGQSILRRPIVMVNQSVVVPPSSVRLLRTYCVRRPFSASWTVTWSYFAGSVFR